MNLPNKLTLARIGLTFIFMLFLFLHWPYAKLAALFIFIIASLSDYYDGKIAKARGEVTDFGKLMDPIADKILVLGAFLAFVELKIIPAWMVVIVILREMIITGMRLLVTAKGKVIPASRQGKHKTISQMITIFIILGYLSIKQLSQGVFGLKSWSANLDQGFISFIYIVMFITVVLTLTSGLSYLKNNMGFLK